MLSYLSDTFASAQTARRRARGMNTCFMLAWFAALAAVAVFVL